MGFVWNEIERNWLSELSFSVPSPLFVLLCISYIEKGARACARDSRASIVVLRSNTVLSLSRSDLPTTTRGSRKEGRVPFFLFRVAPPPQTKTQKTGIRRWTVAMRRNIV